MTAKQGRKVTCMQCGEIFEEFPFPEDHEYPEEIELYAKVGPMCHDCFDFYIEEDD